VGQANCDPIGQVYSLVYCVRDEEDCARINPRDAHQLLLHDDTRLRIEGAERLVHQQRLRIQHVGAGNGHALLHPAGELMGIGCLVSL
jgi:hypothetical protein